MTPAGQLSSPGQFSWHEWSEAAWGRHLPDVADPAAFAAGLGGATIPELAHATANAAPDRPAVLIGGAKLTHGELDARSARVSGWLSARIQPGDRVLLAGPASLEWVSCYLGTLRAGGVAVLSNPAYTEAELGHLVAASETRLAFAWGDSAERLRPAAGAELEVVAEGLPEVLGSPPEPWTRRGGPDAAALLAFTSGTTGRPKGVPLTHRQLLTSIRSAMAAWRWSAEDVLVHALPLFHQHGLGGVHATLVAGSTLHLLPHFTPERLVRTLAEAAATVLFAVPTMYQRLAALEEIAPLPRLRLCVSGSSALGALAARGALALGRQPLVRYGTTETGLDTSHVYSELLDPRQLTTIGVPLPGVEVRLAANSESEPGSDGEIQLRGPQVFGGYWKDASATADAFTADGWFRTGDIGLLDEATGHLMIRGRIKEVIITGGLNVYPREVEIALEEHPAVAEAGVAGLPHEVWGEQVTAWVVLKPGQVVDAPSLIDHAKSLLAPYKRPKQVIFLDEMPRNAAGKIDKRRLAGSATDDMSRANQPNH